MQYTAQTQSYSWLSLSSLSSSYAQVLATMSTEDFSSSTPQDSLEDKLHPPDGDSTPTATQPPLSPEFQYNQLSSSLLDLSTNCNITVLPVTVPSAERSFSKLKIHGSSMARWIARDRLHFERKFQGGRGVPHQLFLASEN